MHAQPNTPPESPVRTPSRAAPRLAVATLVLGVLSLALSLVIVGALVGIVGLLLGGWHLRSSQEGRRMAWTGFWLSAMSLVASVAFLVLYAVGLRHLSGDMGRPRMTSSAALESWRGKRCPDFAVTTLDGTPLRMTDLRGRRVILDFWATWCPPCVEEVPHFLALGREFTTNDLVIVGISAEDRTVLKTFAKSRGVDYALASSAGVELPEPFRGIGSFPTTFFIGRDGNIRDVVVGYQDLENLRRRAKESTDEAGKVEGLAR